MDCKHWWYDCSTSASFSIGFGMSFSTVQTLVKKFTFKKLAPKTRFSFLIF